MSDSQPDSSSDPISCNVLPLVLSSFLDQQYFDDIDPPAQPSIRGRLRKCIDFWRSLEVSQFILNVIIQGYKIPFFHLPTPFSKAKNASARYNSTFVSEAVNDLLKLSLVEEVFCAPDIINPLSISTRSSGKQGLILDLRHVNAFVYKQKFKCEDLSVATQIFDKEYYLYKFDLKSRYHHIEIFPEHRKYLAFAWDFGTGKFRYLRSSVWPFFCSFYFHLDSQTASKILEKSGHSYCHFPGRWPRRGN